jgi:tellurite resistance protein TehA-like permease
MLVGTMAINALQHVSPDHRETLAILITGYILQGVGFGIATCFIVVSQYRDIRYGFHRGASAASGFLACGPFGYTALVLLRLGDHGRQM